MFLLFLLSTSALGATKRVLFIGNSITYFNDMPQVFRDIANQKGDSVQLTIYAPGGTGFQHHNVDPAAYAHLRSGNWDMIVLQPGSNESVGIPPAQPRNTTLAQARMLIDSARRYSPCARIIFYQISYGITGSTAAQITQYNNIMNEIRTTATFLSDSTHLSFAPVGEAFRHVWNIDPTTLLWGAPGDIHPNIKGSYIASCVFYATLFHKPSSGNTIYNGNTPANAAYYQRIADSVVLRHSAEWRIDTSWHRSLFSYSLNRDTLRLHHLSSGHDSLRWFFDGMSTTMYNPVHIFSKAGDYPVRLVTYFAGCTDTATVSVRITTGTSIVNTAAEADLLLYPNPVKDQLQLQVPAYWQPYTVSLFDLTGRELIVLHNPGVIDMSPLTTGIYLLEIRHTNSLRSILRRINVQR